MYSIVFEESVRQFPDYYEKMNIHFLFFENNSLVQLYIVLLTCLPAINI